MTGFWEDFAEDASIQEMMLDANAEELSKHEMPEILSYLPSWNHKDVVELGAGIGRFTGILAKDSNSVVAVDFMEKFLSKNRNTHSHFTNIEFIHADVTKLDLPENKYDMVFSNWLMMYLADSEVQNLLRKELTWLKEGGYLFARESCLGQKFGAFRSGKRASTNPSHYRDPQLYNAMFSVVTVPSSNPDESFGFDLVLSKRLNAYIKLKNFKNHTVWLLQKVRRRTDSLYENKTIQDYIDDRNVSLSRILRYEKMFGSGFAATGRLDITKECVSKLNAQSGQLVLVVGCGTGGSAFYIAKQHGAKVVATDLSSTMINIALKRADESGITEEEIQFEVVDVTKREYKPERFNIIYCTDAISSVFDKLCLFRKFHTWLKHGGQLLVSDYCSNDMYHSDHRKKLVNQKEDCRLLPSTEYQKMLETAGFTCVQADDKTGLWTETVKSDLDKIESMKEDIIRESSHGEYDDLVNDKKEQLERVKNQKYCVFYATKQ